MATAAAITVEPVTATIGAVIGGVDMRMTLDPQTVTEIRQAFLDYGVVFFRDQQVDANELEAFLANFGTPIAEPSRAAYGGDYTTDPVTEADMERHKGVAERWHADATWLAEPPMATLLRMVQPPAVGGDTCWVDVTAAYEALDEPLRNWLDRLTAVHWMEPSLKTMGLTAVTNDVLCIHPVVRVHPETGRKALYVNEGWTRNIVELPSSQSVHLLALLYDHIRSPDFSVRWRWTSGDVAFWDNRSVQHFAVADYTEPRIAQRAVLAGDRPYGPYGPR